MFTRFHIKASLSILIILFGNISISVAQLTPDTEAVINGIDAKPQAWPWMLALLYVGNQSQSFQFRCGATLISERYVLTAAHCVHEYGFTNSPNRLAAVAGKIELTGIKSQSLIKFTDVVVHPAYDENAMALSNDIAILRTKDPVDISKLDIWPSRMEPGATTLVLGWGYVSSTQPIAAAVLQEAVMPVASDRECKRRHGRYFDPETIMCAGVLSSGKAVYDGIDACYGDSGGPLITYVNGKWQQVGIVSSGFECASHAHYGMYTRLSRYYDWIIEQTSPKKDFVYLVRDIYKSAKDFRNYVSRINRGFFVSNTIVSQQQGELEALFRAYIGNSFFQTVKKGKERKLENLLKRFLFGLEQQTLSNRRLKKIIVVSRRLRRRYS